METQYFFYSTNEEAEAARQYAETIGTNVELDSWNQLNFDTNGSLTNEQAETLKSFNPSSYSYE